MSSKRKQRGAVAIEFAAIFGLFFALVYGTIAFGLPAVARLAFQHYSVEASRAALRVDPFVEETVFLERVSDQIHGLITNSWIPEEWRAGCSDLLETEEWNALPDTIYGFWRPEPDPVAGIAPRYQVNVCLQAIDPIVPQLVIGELRFPPYGDNTGRSWVRGYTITTL